MIPRGNASSSAFNVPMALHLSGEQTGGFNPKHAKSRNSRNVQEAEKFILGPMPIQDFLDAFLEDSASDEKKTTCVRAGMLSMPYHSAVRKPQISRNLWYVHRCSGPSSCLMAMITSCPFKLTALRSSTKYKSRCPGFSFQNTSARIRHAQRLSSMKPDIICFASRHLDAVKSSSRRSRADLGYAALFIDVKPDPEQDFFTDPPPDADADALDSHQFILNIDDEDTRQQASRALGQHISYVTEVCARQHRTFCYSISMAGSLARLIRWDRSGAIVTESFDIREHPGHLCEFLWRFSQVSDVERGYDPTVGPAGEGEERLFREAITTYVKLQLDVEEDELRQAVREHYKRGAVSAIHVTVKDDDGYHNRRFIVSRPMMSPLWLVGRGTRGYWAVDADSHQVVFLKDTWRYDGEDDDREGNILDGLNDLGVRYVPTVLCHGDVPKDALEQLERNDPGMWFLLFRYMYIDV
ncbi:hypothetical protein A0H81_08678 [Grifola frondosa]|uniref:Fungal-type protein kinase domain-containing protein n=1 Tax=Grifola frondosa TaxID=5627 RepID=A0A1C7M3S5_GRIFR|nr:hypothetical protein A0H81_08678 [Grifola frondosa]